MKLLIVQSSPASCHFLPVGPNMLLSTLSLWSLFRLFFLLIAAVGIEPRTRAVLTSYAPVVQWVAYSQQSCSWTVSHVVMGDKRYRSPEPTYRF
jgi:hypothetical protein